MKFSFELEHILNLLEFLNESYQALSESTLLLFLLSNFPLSSFRVHFTYQVMNSQHAWADFTIPGKFFRIDKIILTLSTKISS